MLEEQELRLRQHLEMSRAGGLPTSPAATISPTFTGPARRASSETSWNLVGSASALNQLAYSAAMDWSRG